MPSPKTGKSVPPTAPAKPGDVSLVAEVKAGAITAAKAAKPAKLTQAKFSPQKFKKGNPPSAKTPPPEEKSKKPCGLGELVVTDPEDKKPPRKPGPGQILQIVPKATAGEKVKESWVQLVEIETSKGGDDKLEVEIKCKEAGRKQACLLRVGTVTEKDWKEGATHTFTIKAPANKDKWPSDASPEIYYVFGRGCDECYSRCLIEVFPSQTYKVAIDINELKKFIEALSGGFGSVVDYFLPTPGSMSAEDLEGAKEDEAYDEGKAVKKEKLKGKLEVAWNWAEADNDWRAYYGVEIKAGLDPLFSIGFKPKFSFAKLAYTAAGIPPGASDILAAHVADVYVQLELAFELKLVGTAKFHYYTYDDNDHTGSIEFKGTGKLGLVVGAKLGSRWVLAIIVEGAARAEISAGGELEVNHEGLFLKPTVDIAPVTLSVSFKVKAFTRDAYKKEKSWEVGGPWQVYPRPTSEPIKLLPRGK